MSHMWLLCVHNACVYRIVGNFPKVQIFPNLLNGLTTWENLFWAADCFRKLDCRIEIFGILAQVNGNNVKIKFKIISL